MWTLEAMGSQGLTQVRILVTSSQIASTTQFSHSNPRGPAREPPLSLVLS